ncbi:hypothetical protein Snoj_25620 [Streptomyces nojiriensis]|uniref:HEAT repeat domain-containing protein n=1 Tax=Streptomyces nojiriensis TaxID=66374 RepID=A0ABQ3SKN5_9ACTN|nr:hypothetical protein [Streptomyces nojiriensis]QTI50237.1 hypothetical protein JYK04_08113 [Streptomyces nojiriensis]GGS29310.1 hypothetical protein GCM10010205_69210 [Streptomyces nojiriensis]GHI68644.1 hypothetical protein Snoj_25620 [Streptomyces nojiriensis]
MTNRVSWTKCLHPDRLPHYQELLEGTDWASLATPYGTGESLPTALARLLDPNPAVRAAAVKDVSDEVDHQNTIYEATVPVALYFAAILNHPATEVGDLGHDADVPSRHPTRASLLNRLGATAYDAEYLFGEGFLQACPDTRAFRRLRPAVYSAVQPFLGHDNAKVRDEALVAAIPLTEDPRLTPHRAELVEHARFLLTTSTNRYHRDCALNALNTWGHDTSDLEDANDIASRELQARLADFDYWSANNGTGGGTEDPPF